MSLKGRSAIVTGAGSQAGLGFATARALGSEGARVVLTDIDAERIDEAVAVLRSEGLDVVACVQDASCEAGWASTIKHAVDAYGRLDILVNNAGIAILKPLNAMTLDEWDRQIAVNLTSVFLGTQGAIGQMRDQGTGGAIVNVSSIAGLVGVPGGSAYAASKAGVRLFTKAVALECAREAIRVNSVHPGVIWTEMQQIAIRDNPEAFDAINASIPMGRMGDPDDIAQMIQFLVSDRAKYITGSEFVVDGGFTAQ